MSKKTVNEKKQHDLLEQIKNYIRANSAFYLKDKNINSIGIGYKQKAGKDTDEISIQFTVNTKAKPEALGLLNTQSIPESIEIEGVKVPTDVVQRSFKISKLVAEAATPPRKTRINPILPGISVGHTSITAGTIGCIVYDKNNGTPYILSNWHVLHSNDGTIGDTIVQPGPHDDNRIAQNNMGKLVRSHLGEAGDCAIATIDDRNFNTNILGFDVTPDGIAEPELGDILIKSGRTTGVTLGKVTRIHTISRIDYEGTVGEVSIGGFEIGVASRFKPLDGEISRGGDSGAVWMVATSTGKSTKIIAGLHFGGEADGNPDEFALACYPKSVFEKLEITIKPPVIDDPTPTNGVDNSATGYNATFLGDRIPMPELKTAHKNDAVTLNNSSIINYVHFSLILSKSRRFAHIVGWNIDGGRLLSLSRKNLRFKLDSRIKDDAQVGEALYSRNRLDRGHIARRADLIWGSKLEAQKANEDSFYFTNIVPQMDNFNQSGAGGIWGQLEDAVFAQVDVQDLRISVFGGPIFKDNDRIYRGVKIPREFFKSIVYREANKLKVKSFILSQNLNQIEVLDLEPFKVYEVALNEVSDRSKIDFPSILIDSDTFRPEVEALDEQETERNYLQSIEDIVW